MDKQRVNNKFFLEINQKIEKQSKKAKKVGLGSKNFSKGRMIFHLYDQGFRSYLMQHCSGEIANDFVERLNREIWTDLFVDGYKLVDTPFAFLEAIGITKFKDNEIKEEVFSELVKLLPEIRAGEIQITDLPDFVFDFCHKYFLRLEDIFPEKLRFKAEDQFNYKLENIVFDDLQNCIFKYRNIKNIKSLSAYHKFICYCLAVEYAQKFNYFDILKKIYEGKGKDRVIIEAWIKIYHAFFKALSECIRKGYNISFFRALDIYRKNIFMFDNPRENIAFLHPKCDFLDSYIIHFAIFGYFFEDQFHKTIIFTFDEPAQIKLRLEYALSVYDWISSWMEKEFNFKPNIALGTIYCFDKELNIVEVIEVDKISFSKINE